MSNDLTDVIGMVKGVEEGGASGKYYLAIEDEEGRIITAEYVFENDHIGNLWYETIKKKLDFKSVGGVKAKIKIRGPIIDEKKEYDGEGLVKILS